MTGFQKWQAMKAVLRPPTGYHSDIATLTDEELQDKKSRAELWLEENKNDPNFDFYSERFDVIKSEIARRELVAESMAQIQREVDEENRMVSVIQDVFFA